MEAWHRRCNCKRAIHECGISWVRAPVGIIKPQTIKLVLIPYMLNTQHKGVRKQTLDNNKGS
jgi:hypothetical protein